MEDNSANRISQIRISFFIIFCFFATQFLIAYNCLMFGTLIFGHLERLIEQVSQIFIYSGLFKRSIT